MNKASDKFCALIMAAGSSSRMGGTPKQFIDIDGKTVLLRSMEAFEGNDMVDKIIVVTKREFFDEVRQQAQNGNITKFVAAVEGADSRMESVKKGIAHIGDSKFVMVHDCARPLVTNKVICDVADAALEYGAAICGVDVKDTIKSVNADKTVKSTLDRATLVSVQTPQGFKAEILIKALNETENLCSFTDDASVVENVGYTVKVVAGDYENIKITTSEDVATAVGFLKGRKCK